MASRGIKLFDLSTLSRREIIIVLAVCALFLVFQSTVVGIMPAHFVMVGLFVLFYFAHPASRKLALALMPFIMFEICYDWMRLYPNYRANPIDIEGLYNAELSLFGITSEGVTMIPGEYFNQHHNAVADFLAGCFYLCWVPVPMLFGIWLYFKGERSHYLHFALCFLFVNLIGFAGYYIHPAAPPWYAINYGFEPDYSMPGNVAGLIRFDEMVGVPVWGTTAPVPSRGAYRPPESDDPPASGASERAMSVDAVIVRTGSGPADATSGTAASRSVVRK